MPSALDMLNGTVADKPKSALDMLNASAAPPEEPSSATGRFLGGAWENVNPIAGVKGLMGAVAHPIQTGGAILRSQGDQFVKAYGDWKKGHYVEAAGHAAAGALPLVGPAAAEAGETIASGDIAGGLGKGVGLVGSMLAPGRAPGKVGEAVEGASNTLKKGAERIISSNLKTPESLINRNPTKNIPRIVLEGKYSPGFKGARQAGAVEATNAEKLLKNSAGVPGKHSLQPVLDSIDQLERDYRASGRPPEDLAQLDRVRQEVMNTPAYSKQVYDANGNPIGRELTKQNATDVDMFKQTARKKVSESYGKDAGPTKEAWKSVGRGFGELQRDVVPEAGSLLAKESDAIVAKKALSKMGKREGNKYNIGLMDFLGAGEALGAVASGNPLLAALGVGGIALKHPTTAFPIARGVDRVGKLVGKTAPAAKALTTGATVGKVIDNALRPVKKEEVDSKFAAWQATK